MTRDTSTLMVGQYFKRRRELVEILLGRGQFLSGKSDPLANVQICKHQADTVPEIRFIYSQK
jgi:hypothetical protein